MNNSEKVKWQEITQRLTPWQQEFMDLFSRTLAVQCPSDSFPTEILNPHERGLLGSFWHRYLPLCQSVTTQEIGHIAQMWPPGTHPCYKGVFPEKGDWCELGCLSSSCPLQSQSGGHGVTGLEHVRGGIELRRRCGICGRAALVRKSPVTSVCHTLMLI